MTEFTLFSVPFYADGTTFEPQRDRARLGAQMQAVQDYMLSHEWVTLPELHAALGGSEAGLSARLRDLRKARYGAHTVERKSVGGGLFAYRVRRQK